MRYKHDTKRLRLTGLIGACKDLDSMNSRDDPLAAIRITEHRNRMLYLLQKEDGMSRRQICRELEKAGIKASQIAALYRIT